MNKEAEERLVASEVVVTNQETVAVELYEYRDMDIDTEGPKVPPNLQPYFSAIRSPQERQLAGGFTIELGLNRALADAFSCLAWRSQLGATATNE